MNNYKIHKANTFKVNNNHLYICFVPLNELETKPIKKVFFFFKKNLDKK